MSTERRKTVKFVAVVQNIAQFYDYDAALEDMFHDRLVCGVNDSWIQWWLLSETELTFKKAFNISQAIKAAEKDSKDLDATHRKTNAGADPGGG